MVDFFDRITGLQDLKWDVVEVFEKLLGLVGLALEVGVCQVIMDHVRVLLDDVQGSPWAVFTAVLVAFDVVDVIVPEVAEGGGGADV
jgi:hypothetical protein